jgi:hypothetical protein
MWWLDEDKANVGACDAVWDSINEVTTFSRNVLSSQAVSEKSVNFYRTT